MKPIAILNPDDEKFLIIQYAVTNVCNYNCNYCWPDSHAGTSRWPDYDIITKNFDHLIATYKQHYGKEVIRLHLLGGETTLWPKLGEFVKFIKEKHDCRITMASNGSRTLRWWNQFAEYFNDIQISVHHEFCDIEHIEQVMDTIYNKGNIMVSACVLMDPLAWDKCQNLLDDLIAYPAEWLVKVKTIIGTDEFSIRDEYNEQHIDFMKDKIKRLPPQEYIKKMQELGNIEKNKTTALIKYEDGSTVPYNTFTLLKDKQNTFFGWDCNLGKDRITIQHSGRLQGTCGELKVFGDKTFHIHDADFVEKFTPDVIKPVKCSMIFCGCSADMRLAKQKNV
jgi:molybdenum cofactor biosynthesis enzyme MoaA